MSSYSGVLMKKDLYKEYRNTIDRYLPIEQVQKEMEKNNLKYILHQYLRVRNLCDQGIDDPDDVADILNIPQYMAEDLVEEYYLIPKEFDRRNANFANDPRLKLLEGLPYIMEPRRFLQTYPDATVAETALYVGVYSLIWMGAKKNNPWLFTPPKSPKITDDFCFGEFFREKSEGEPTLIDAGPSALDSAYDMLPLVARQMPWVEDFKNELKDRIKAELQKNNGPKLKMNPGGIDKKLWKQFPGYTPPEKVVCA